MKRILICATQVPFVRGGAELLVDGLRDALRERGHTVDVISLPFAWQPHELIGRSALAWRLLPEVDIAPELAEGRVVHVLPDWQMSPIGVYAVTMRRDSQPPKVRMAIDALRDYLQASGSRALASHVD